MKEGVTSGVPLRSLHELHIYLPRKNLPRMAIWKDGISVGSNNLREFSVSSEYQPRSYCIKKKDCIFCGTPESPEVLLVQSILVRSGHVLTVESIFRMVSPVRWYFLPNLEIKTSRLERNLVAGVFQPLNWKFKTFFSSGFSDLPLP